jgi:hypothetical protein
MAVSFSIQVYRKDSGAGDGGAHAVVGAAPLTLSGRRDPHPLG